MGGGQRRWEGDEEVDGEDVPINARRFVRRLRTRAFPVVSLPDTSSAWQRNSRPVLLLNFSESFFSFVAIRRILRIALRFEI